MVSILFPIPSSPIGLGMAGKEYGRPEIRRNDKKYKPKRNDVHRRWQISSVAFKMIL